MALHELPFPSDNHTVLVFGPQALSFDIHCLKRLRSAVSRRPDRAWILDAIDGLPKCWETFADAFPKFKTHDGLRQLQHLHDWFANRAESTDLAADSLPNLLLSPLVVVSQIVDLLEHTDGVSAAPQEGVFELQPVTIATIGLCTGILGALAVALSKNTSSLRDYAARSIRIAMLIGGVVDTQGRQALAGQWKALATAWSTAGTQEVMKRVLTSFPEARNKRPSLAYVSVHYDENRVTVTAPATATSALQRELRAVGVVTSESGLRGSFHHPSHKEDADLLSRYCDRSPSSLALPEPSHLVHPVLFSPIDTASDGAALHTQAVQAILVEQSQWVQTFRNALNRWIGSGNGKVHVLGPERCIPPSLVAGLGLRVTYSTPKPGSAHVPMDKSAGGGQPRPRKPDDIANLLRVVPSSPSLADLFIKVLDRAQLAPHQIGYVEAHGTSTQVGHTPQPSFITLNPHIPALPTDNIRIAAAVTPWEADGQLRAVLINNYGASGSNASMVVTESPVACRRKRPTQSMSNTTPGTLIRIEGPNDAALKRYVTRLIRFLQNGEHGSCTVADVAFNLSRQCSNLSSERVLAFSCRSMTELMSRLGEIQDGQGESAMFTPPAPRPVILYFGGQVSTYVGLDRGVYETALVFRQHLDECDSVYRALGARSLFSEVFIEAAVEDVVQLQAMLFASHFGELTALCVAGVLTLSDALRMIVGRATIIRDSWGDEKGSMLAIHAHQSEVDSLLAEARQRSSQGGDAPSTIACVNGPQSLTLAGSSRSIDSVAALVASDARWSSTRCKRLNVTNAFHSTLVESLKPQLLELGQQPSFNAPLVPIETATRSRSSWTEVFTPFYVAEHLRNPVYFHQATQRLSEQYPAAIWLEAGSNSTITNMASRALGSPTSSFFQSINIGGGQGTQHLASGTFSLWKAGLRHVPWRHHRCQTCEYAPLLLPPYQFEATRHWMDYKMAPRGADARSLENGTSVVATQEEPQGLWDFVKWKDSGHRRALFRINTNASAYRDMVSGHVIAQTAPICPATVELDIVIEALMSVRQSLHLEMQPRIQNVTNQAAICHSPARSVWLDMEATDNTCDTWTWRFTSDEQKVPGASTVLHAQGQVVFVAIKDEISNLDFTSYERLVSHGRSLDLLDHTVSSDDVIQGRGIYRTFSPVVDYGPAFQGLQRLVSRGNHSAGRVVSVPGPSTTKTTWLDAHLSDSFCQVGGIWVNCMNDCDPGDMYLATGIGRWIRSPQMRHRPATQSWDILASHHVVSKQTVLTDIFVFEAAGGSLVEVILGIKYHKVAKASMSRLISKLASTDVTSTTTTTTQVEDRTRSAIALPEENHDTNMPLGRAETAKQQPAMEEASRNVVTGKIRALIADISGLESHEIADDAQLADLGIDSLMGMEVAQELGGLFDISISIMDLETISDFRSLVDYMHGVLGLSHNEGGADGGDTSASSLRSEGYSEGPQENGHVSPPSSDGELPDQADGDCDSQPQLTLQSRAVVHDLLRQYTAGFSAPASAAQSQPGSRHTAPAPPPGACVVVTGGTGSLGAHMVAHLANQTNVDTVVCLNRRSATADTDTRQRRAFEQRGLSLAPAALAKVRVLEADTAAPRLGLSEAAYDGLVASATHVVHNAWPMTSKRPLSGLEAQFRVMRNLIDLARSAASGSRGPRIITFQFVSSIATVGHYPYHSGDVVVPEERMAIESVLPNGYGEAKWICERMLDETLHRYPDAFRPMVVRPGQIAGSSASGYWNPQEHLSFLLKSSQSLRCLPDLRGDLCWTPADVVAEAVGDLLLSPRATRPVYHIDNPARQRWEHMVPALAALLGVEQVVPFDEWLRRVRAFTGPPCENPAAQLADFLEHNFVRMSCGGLLLDTARACEHSPALGLVGPVSNQVVERYIRHWKDIHFLSS
ncbi:polyketide synthase [Apiospora saccharicola]